MKTYVLTLSKVFPASHYRKGEPTNFRAAFNSGQPFKKDADTFCEFPKLHTIRANYELWAKRFEQIERGEAQLSIRQWSGLPYRSKQIQLVLLSRKDGIGLQRLMFDKSRFLPNVDYHPVGIGHLANNDGLTLDDWEEWFKNYDLSKPLAVIQFTKFRY